MLSGFSAESPAARLRACVQLRLWAPEPSHRSPVAADPARVATLSHSSLEVCVLYSALYGYSEEKRLFTTPP
jgi:hypothetical protein